MKCDEAQIMLWLQEIMKYKGKGHYQGKISYDILIPTLILGLQALCILRRYKEDPSVRELLKKIDSYECI